MFCFASKYRWLSLVLYLSTTLADTFEPTAHYQVCFTPYQNCSQRIITAIGQARAHIHVQAYSFTSKPIIEALQKAQGRGVQVRLILDKLHEDQPELARRLVRHRMAVWIDHPTGIAHNKLIIIDHNQVITGSFNFTHAAQHRNVENVLIIRDQALAARYLHHWYRRQAQATPFKQTASHSSDRFIILVKKNTEMVN